MYRLSRMGRQWYAKEFNDLDNEIKDIEALVEEGDNVLIVTYLSQAENLLNIESDEIIIVEDE